MITVPARLADEPGALGAVGAGAAEDHRDQALPENLSGAAHEQVHRGLGPPLAVHLQVYRVVGDVDVPVGGDHVNDAGLQGLVVGDGADGQPAAAGEDLLQPALPGGVEVLGEHEGRGEAFG